MADLKTFHVFGFVPVPSSADGELDIHSFCVPARILKVYSDLDSSWLEWARKNYAELSESTHRIVERMQNASALPASYLPLYVGVDFVKDVDPERKNRFITAMQKLFERMISILDERTSELDERFAPFITSKPNVDGPDALCMQKLLSSIGVEVSSGVTTEEASSFDVLMGACVARMGWGPKEFRESFLTLPEQNVVRMRSILSESDRLRARLFASIGKIGKVDDKTAVSLTWWGGKPNEKDKKVGELRFSVEKS